MDNVLDKAPVGGKYTESKLVFFSADIDDWDADKLSYTNAKLNAEINKYIKAGWEPTQITSPTDGIITILFCR